MKVGTTVKTMLAIGISVTGLTLGACGEEPPVPPPPAPPEYADKHMPEGYWNNPDIIAEGKAIFIGAENIDVNCASCHGKDGKPVKAGARDFRRSDWMSLYSDSVWFWRVSEGVKGTKMKPWKTKLSEDDRWKVIAFESTFALKGQEWDVAANKWVPAGTAGKPGAPAVEAGGAEGEAPATSEAEAPSAGEETPSEEKSPE